MALVAKGFACRENRAMRLYMIQAAMSGFVILAGCGSAPSAWDVPTDDSNLSTAAATRSSAATLGRNGLISSVPTPDASGIITYPNYRVVLARSGETVAGVAGRLGFSPPALASLNGLREDDDLRVGERLLLPKGAIEVAQPPLSDGSGQIDVVRLASEALEEVEATTNIERPPVSDQGRSEDLPLVPVAPPTLLAKPLAAPVPVAAPVTPPAIERRAPPPPGVAQEAPVAAVPSSNGQLGSLTGTMLLPVSGAIIRSYGQGGNEGIDIAAPVGAPVQAADRGSVAAITQDTNQTSIVVVAHDGNLLTIYAGVDQISVKRGDKVARGQKIAVLDDSTPSFLHFEVRRGVSSVDPAPFLR